MYNTNCFFFLPVSCVWFTCMSVCKPVCTYGELPPRSLWHLNTCSPDGGTVSRDLGGVVLLGEVRQSWWVLRFQGLALFLACSLCFAACGSRYELIAVPASLPF